MKPQTLQDAIKYFSDPNNCMNWLVTKRWPDGVPVCPQCGRADATYLRASQKWQCKSAHRSRQFSARVGTIFEDSPIALEKWLLALWMACNCKNGVSSYEIHRAIGVTQKSAWFMLHRIRAAMQSGSVMKVGGPGSTVEADETVIGGKLKNMHNSRKREMALGQYGGYRRHQSYVMGVLDRDAKQVRATVIPFAGREPMISMIKDHVEPETTMITDAHVGYDKLKDMFPHEVINHMEAYVRGKVHTNGIENFWSLLKRGLNGTYISVEPFHLFRYVDEQVFRYNNRGGKKQENRVTDGDRFDLALSQVVGKRLTLAEVTGKNGTPTPF